MSGHTPTPWRVTRDERGEIIRAVDDTGRPIASMWLNGDDAEANAAFIVEAVNSHAALKARIEALEAALEPFAEIAKELEPMLADNYKNTMHWAVPTVGDLRRAALAMNSQERGSL